MARHRQAFIESVGQVLDRGSLLLGPELLAFEGAFARCAGGRECVGVASGASALQLALAALDVGPGDEVIVPAMTAVPTAAAVCAVGATPVFADVELATAALDPSAAQAALTARTRAVIGVHLYGRPFDVGALVAAVGVPVVEDSAQAHGATARVAGTMAAYSFYPTKNLGGVGDGGALVTDDAGLAERVRRLRAHGMAEQYVHVEISQNFRMSEIEAAWLGLTLPFLAADNERRRSIAAAYRQAAPHLVWQADHPSHVHHLAVVRAHDRAAFRKHLDAKGVGSAVHYPLALTQQPAYTRFAGAPCPNAELWSAGCVSVPCFPELTDAEVATVCDALQGAPA
ncbi:MAG: DegT/DnrJ/EryC1/StrS family aminotransferase [Ilumatobacteraceae bacterium]